MTALGTLELIWSDDSTYPIRLRTHLVNGRDEGCWVNFSCEQAIDIATQLLVSVRETKATQAAAPRLSYTGLAPPIEEYQPVVAIGKPRRSRPRRRTIKLIEPPEPE